MAMGIRKNDVVEVICGDHRGARGKVLRVDRRRDLVVVEGVNMVYRHVRPTRRNPQGGRVQKEAPIHLSNVLPYDPTAGRGQRVRFAVERGPEGRVGKKRRVTVKGTTLHEMTRAERK
ncbi:MAG TPA: 50S ribosomal protein L24 [Phycisphaerae bacterium]|nr:50S ribosomal protein L24 [Phycisphaerae bacterium]HNU44464.1 50S ribosomal protein L24 [Phycisphaerae bacterium]